MLKIALLGIVIALLALPFKLIKAEYSLYIGFAGCLLIFYFAVGKLRTVIEMLHMLSGYLPIDNGYLEILLKMVGITYITEFSMDMCKDAGYGAVANQIGVAGKLTLLGLSLPVLSSLLTCISKLWMK